MDGNVRGSKYGKVRRGWKYTCGARWCRGMFGALQPEGCGFESTSRGIFGALQPEGCGFESTSSRRVGTLGKSFTRNCSCASA